MNRPEANATPSAATVGVGALGLPPAPPRQLSVHIDRVVLDEGALGGLRLDARARAMLQATLQGELSAQLQRAAGLGKLGVGGSLAWLHAGELRFSAGQDAATFSRALPREPARELARQLARALQTEFR